MGLEALFKPTSGFFLFFELPAKGVDCYVSMAVEFFDLNLKTVFLA